MKAIPSFCVNHLLLERGVYISRIDRVGNDFLTTFDIRMKEPNREPAMGIKALHTIEHLAATYLRNDAEWGNRIIYWGPMGCLTGCYLIVKGQVAPREITPLLQRTYAFIATYRGRVPGATAKRCGNYRLHCLREARSEAKKYLNILCQMTEQQMTYPTSK